MNGNEDLSGAYERPLQGPGQPTDRAGQGLSRVRAVVAMTSAKGGAGKSALTVNLAAVLASRGKKVGIIDADLCSPSVATMLGIGRVRLSAIGGGIEPAGGPLGLRVVAADLLAAGSPAPIDLSGGEPAMVESGDGESQGRERAASLAYFLERTSFGGLDLLLVDLAPGPQQFSQLVKAAPMSCAVLVTQPSGLALRAARSAIEAARRENLPLLGIIENMVGFYCENCRLVRPLLPQGGAGGLAREFELPILGRLPFDPRLADFCDRGEIFARRQADAPLAKQLDEVAQRLEEAVAARLRPSLAAPNTPSEQAPR